VLTVGVVHAGMADDRQTVGLSKVVGLMSRTGASETRFLGENGFLTVRLLFLWTNLYP